MDKPLLIITGSTGMIGRALCRALADDYQVLGLDVKPPQKEDLRCHWIPCDLTDDASVEETFSTIANQFGRNIASFIHLAAYYDFSGEPNDLYRRLTVDGTRRVLRGLQNFNVDQFVFSSSLLVMQPREDGRTESLSEQDPLSAKWPYPRSKLDAESVIVRERGSIPVVIHRIAGVYDDACNSIPLSRQIQRIYERRLESYFFPGDADRGQAFVHVDDLVACFKLTVEKRGDLDDIEVFLIGEEEVVSYRALQESLGKLIHGKAWPALRIPKSAAKAGAWVKEHVTHEEVFIKPWMIELADDDYPIEIQRARAKLGWEPKHHLHKTLLNMVLSLKRDPAAWYSRHNLEFQREQEAHPPAANQ